MQHPWNGHFWGVPSPLSQNPQVQLYFAKILTRGKVICLSRDGTYPKVNSFGPFFGPIYPRKKQNIAQVETFQKTASSVISNNTSCRPQNFLPIMCHCSKYITTLKIFSRSIKEQNEDMKFQNFRLSMTDKKFTKFFLSFLKLSGTFSANYASFFASMIHNSGHFGNSKPLPALPCTFLPCTPNPALPCPAVLYSPCY